MPLQIQHNKKISIMDKIYSNISYYSNDDKVNPSCHHN
jgi:hypothetical protein